MAKGEPNLHSGENHGHSGESQVYPSKMGVRDADTALALDDGAPKHSVVAAFITCFVELVIGQFFKRWKHLKKINCVSPAVVIGAVDGLAAEFAAPGAFVLGDVVIEAGI